MSTSFRLHSILCALVLLVSAAASAQAPADNQARDKIMAELRPYKHEFLIKDLKIDKEKAPEFIALYDKMDDRLQQINDETRRLERNVEENSEATDTEIEAAARATFSQKQREAEVELEYYDKFKEVLTPRQLLRLKGAERRFNQWLVRHHRRMSRERSER